MDSSYNGVKQAVPVATQLVTTDNQFEVLSDHDNDGSVDTNNFGTSEVDTNIDATDKAKRKTKSSRMSRKSAKNLVDPAASTLSSLILTLMKIPFLAILE